MKLILLGIGFFLVWAWCFWRLFENPKRLKETRPVFVWALVALTGLAEFSALICLVADKNS